MAATVMDLLSAIEPKAVLFLGKCGGLKKTKVGDFLLPIAAIRGEGTSNDYMPPEIPALPSFRLQRAVSAMIVKHGLDYWTGTVYTTNRRVWEHDEKFKQYLRDIRAAGIDMETATIFIVGFVNHIPKGALLLVSDSPMTPEGVKTSRERRPDHREVRQAAPGDRHRRADRAPRLRRVGGPPPIRIRASPSRVRGTHQSSWVARDWCVPRTRAVLNLTTTPGPRWRRDPSIRTCGGRSPTGRCPSGPSRTRRTPGRGLPARGAGCWSGRG